MATWLRTFLILIEAKLPLTMAEGETEYLLGYRRKEITRLSLQAALLDPLTETFLRQAGVCSGMTVLDCGSGGGHVSAVVAKIVGPQGQVVGVDRNDTTFAEASDRLRADGLTNVSFVQAELSDLTALPDYGHFDAVVGRLVLLYLPQPQVFLKKMISALRPGGIVAFQELAITKASAHPPCQALEVARDLIADAFRSFGADPDLGMSLSVLFADSGLEATLTASAPIDTYDQGRILSWVGATLDTLTDPILRSKLQSEASLARLVVDVCREIESHKSIVIGPMLIGAHAEYRGA
jgi:2-polyprenyl-3-methyl-5-hydroxy-6-metoxy-1,4-benzoquinol methylase